jgi:hypothetical protein
LKTCAVAGTVITALTPAAASANNTDLVDDFIGQTPLGFAVGSELVFESLLLDGLRLAWSAASARCAVLLARPHRAARAVVCMADGFAFWLSKRRLHTGENSSAESDDENFAHFDSLIRFAARDERHAINYDTRSERGMTAALSIGSCFRNLVIRTDDNGRRIEDVVGVLIRRFTLRRC